MVPFDVMTGRNSMVCNSRGVTYLCKSFEMLGLPLMQSSFCFADVEGITVPTTGFVYYFRSLRTTETIFVREKRLNPASVLGFQNTCRVKSFWFLKEKRTSARRFSTELSPNGYLNTLIFAKQ